MESYFTMPVGWDETRYDFEIIERRKYGNQTYTWFRLYENGVELPYWFDPYPSVNPRKSHLVDIINEVRSGAYEWQKDKHQSPQSLPVEIHHIEEYGLRQKLSNGIKCF